ncbi:MAG: DUF1015 domain-containing protein, partial [Calditrichaeota bacterium]|nr:DUF1015 domain-containing protein [Calditrichota bacterium]
MAHRGSEFSTPCAAPDDAGKIDKFVVGNSVLHPKNSSHLWRNLRIFTLGIKQNHLAPAESHGGFRFVHRGLNIYKETWMAQIAPFRAYRFDPAVVGDLTPIVTQPYDKIGPKLQEEYYARSPYNVARVIKSKEQVANPSTDYPEAGQLFRQWLSSGVLRSEAEPGLYPYYQIFKVDGREFTRKGFVALVALEEGQVRAHERTLAGPKADRLRLLRQIEANDELIFMLFSDAQGRVVNAMEQSIANRPPIIE